jgi:hypothetical protein
MGLTLYPASRLAKKIHLSRSNHPILLPLGLRPRLPYPVLNPPSHTHAVCGVPGKTRQRVARWILKTACTAGHAVEKAFSSGILLGDSCMHKLRASSPLPKRISKHGRRGFWAWRQNGDYSTSVQGRRSWLQYEHQYPLPSYFADTGIAEDVQHRRLE